MLGLDKSGHWVIFLAYIVLCVSNGILVTWSQDEDKEYSYNATAVILHADALKLLLALSVVLYSKTFAEIIGEISRNLKVCALYFIPSFLYAVYNNLIFVNLQYFDPTSYYILMQLRVVVSGVVYQVLFHRKLSRTQWISLVVLMSGCMLKQVNFHRLTDQKTRDSEEELAENTTNFANILALIVANPGTIFLVVQILCSTVAGVYTELLVKQHSSALNFWIQNIFMYFNSLVCGLFIFIPRGKPYQELFCLLGDNVSFAHRTKTMAVVCNMAAMGITTALFLKFLNSIVKNFATAIEVILTAFLSWVIFGFPVTLHTLVALVIIVFSMWLYSTNPLAQVPLAYTKVPRKAKLSES